MKTLPLATWIGASVALAAPAAAAEWFVRPSVLHVYYQNAGLPDKDGASLAAGARFGPRAEHELSLEGDRSTGRFRVTDTPALRISGRPSGTGITPSTWPTIVFVSAPKAPGSVSILGPRWVGPISAGT